jgi:Flp pilus assembly pilin Flp
LRRFERSLLRSESGQTLVEYSLILVLVALVCFAALGVIGGTVKDFLQSMAMQV